MICPLAEGWCSENSLLSFITLEGFVYVYLRGSERERSLPQMEWGDRDPARTIMRLPPRGLHLQETRVRAEPWRSDVARGSLTARPSAGPWASCVLSMCGTELG